MIRFSNGHVFEYMAASGALGFDGQGWPWEKMLGLARLPGRKSSLFDPSLFTVVLKTITLPPRPGHLLAVRFIDGGVVNAMRLGNKGLDWFVEKIGPKINSTKIPSVGSIFGEVGELEIMAQALNDFDLVGLEINGSCPNTETDILCNPARVIKSCEVVKKNSRFPLILKLSVAHDTEQIVKGVEDFIEAFSINSVPWEIAFPNLRSPLANLGGGGVSGKVVQPFTWELVKKLATLTSIPVIGPSVWDFDDLKKIRGIGAKAISFGSIFLYHPWRPTLYVRQEQKLKQLRV